MKGKICLNCKHLGCKKYCTKFNFRVANISTARCCSSYEYIQTGAKKNSYKPIYNQNQTGLKFKNVVAG